MPTESKNERINELRKELITCGDPFALLAEYRYENERLRKLVRMSELRK